MNAAITWLTGELGEPVAALFVLGTAAFIALLAIMVPAILAYEYGKDWLNK